MVHCALSESEKSTLKRNLELKEKGGAWVERRKKSFVNKTVSSSFGVLRSSKDFSKMNEIK